MHSQNAISGRVGIRVTCQLSFGYKSLLPFPLNIELQKVPHETLQTGVFVFETDADCEAYQAYLQEH